MNFSFAELPEEPETTDANRDRSIICGDCLEVMPTLEANSIDSIVTDPPYGLSFMGKDWDFGVPGVAFWKEALRVAKPGAHLLAFGGTRTFHRLVVAIEDAGWEIRDMIEWVYGSGFPKSLNISKAIDKEAGAEREVVEQKNYGGRNRFSVTAGASNGGVQGGYNFGDNRSITAPATPDAVVWDGWGTGLKPSHESIIVARKPIEKGLTIAQNCLKWGTGGINVDGCRVSLSDGDKTERKPTPTHSNIPFIASKNSGSMNDDWKKGRFPANLIHDGSEEVLACFPGDRPGGNFPERERKPPRQTLRAFGEFKGIAQSARAMGDSGSASRYFKCCSFDKTVDEDSAKLYETGEIKTETIGIPTTENTVRLIYQSKASKQDRDEGLENMESKSSGVGALRDNGRESLPRHNNHPTVKPTKLMAYLCRLITPPEGLVLDPFAGSGSTGKACKLEGFRFIGIEKDEEYCKIARARIE